MADLFPFHGRLRSLARFRGIPGSVATVVEVFHDFLWRDARVHGPVAAPSTLPLAGEHVDDPVYELRLLSQRSVEEIGFYLADRVHDRLLSAVI